MKRKYREIIDLEYQPSPKYPRMTRESRAAQFMAFKALRGFEERLEERDRERVSKKLLAKDQKDLLNYQLSEILAGDREKKYRFTYFKRDNSMIYGTYESLLGSIDKIESEEGLIYLRGGEKIRIDDLMEIEGL